MNLKHNTETLNPMIKLNLHAMDLDVLKKYSIHLKLEQNKLYKKEDVIYVKVADKFYDI